MFRILLLPFTPPPNISPNIKKSTSPFISTTPLTKRPALTPPCLFHMLQIRSQIHPNTLRQLLTELYICPEEITHRAQGYSFVDL